MDEERDNSMPDNNVPVAPGTGLVVALNSDGLYEVAFDKDKKTAILIGVDPPFPPERWDVMVARCLAHGLTLVKRGS